MKILGLTTKDFLRGVTTDQNHKGGAVLQTNGTCNLFYPGYEGVCMNMVVPTEITGGVGGKPLSHKTRITGSSAGTLYIGTASGVSEISLATVDANATTTLTQANMTNGLELFQPRGATAEYLYYWQKTQIGRYGDLNGTPAATAAWATGLESTDYHPTHKMFDEIYYGNKDRIGQIKDDGAGGVTHSTNVLDFESNKVVTCLADDGQFLVIGLTENKGDDDLGRTASIRFWDKVSNSWNYEWKINETSIHNIKSIGGVLFVVCPSGVYKVTRTTPPRKVQDLKEDTTSNLYGNTGSVDVLGSAVVFPHQATISSYGSIKSGLPEALHTQFYHLYGTYPFASQEGVSVGSVYDAGAFTDVKSTIVGYSDGKLFRFPNEVGADADAGIGGIVTTIFDLNGLYSVNRVDVELTDATLSGSQSVYIDVTSPGFSHFSGTATATDPHQASGLMYTATFYGSTRPLNQIYLTVNTSGGFVGIKAVTV